MSAYRAAPPRARMSAIRLRAPISLVPAWTCAIFALIFGLGAGFTSGSYRLHCVRAEGTCVLTTSWVLPVIARRRTFPVAQLHHAELVVDENEDDKQLYGVRLFWSDRQELLRNEVGSDHELEKRAFIAAVTAFVEDPSRATLDVGRGSYRPMIVWALFALVCAACVHGARRLVVVDPERSRLTLRRWFGLSQTTVPLHEVAYVRLHTRRSEDDENELTGVVLERRGKPMIDVIAHGSGEVARKRAFAKALWSACAPSCTEKSG